MKIRNSLSAALAAFLLAGSVIAPYTASAEDIPHPDIFLYGDANQDTIVDVSDAVLIARFAAEDPEARISGEGQICADVNLDTYINSKDLIAVLQYIAKNRDVLGYLEADEHKESAYKAVNLTEKAETVKIKAKQCDETFLASQCNLTVNLLKQAYQTSKNENMMISPLSISEALAMTANGAKGQTQDEIANVLGGDISMDDLNAYYYDYTTNLKNTNNAMLKQANSIWVRDDKGMIEVPDSFLQIVKSNYNAQVFLAPFDRTTVTDVNNWVNFHTDQMIPKLLDNISDDSVMYLINALSFDAKWDNPYSPQYNVHEAKFTNADNENIDAEMMYGTEYTYLEDENAIGFIKPYCDRNYSFAAILPKQGISLDSYISKMTGESLKKMLNKRYSETVYTSLPKFSFDYDIKLNEPLKKMGMPTAFDPDAADFTGLNTKLPTYIGQVIHKTHIAVDEEGTKAAAVTAVEMAAGCAMIEPKEVYLDRPFLFMILDENTKLPVFIGAVTDPTK